MKTGDIVGRKSYGSDILFKVSEIFEDGSCCLTGVNFRLKIYTTLDDLDPAGIERVLELRKDFLVEANRKIKKILSNRTYNDKHYRPGKVLHIDSDEEYLTICLGYYKKLAIPAVGIKIKESEQPGNITHLLQEHLPDILIITGHDSLKNSLNPGCIENYRSSEYFIETVKAARRYNPSKDSLVIIAGACQSYFEGIIMAEANIAASPARILIHALDPVFAAERIAYTGIDRVLSIEEILENNITGTSGMGGYETRGVLRKGFGMSTF